MRKGSHPMSARLVSVLALLLVSCAAWESSTPNNSPPPVDGPVPSHYAPPPPGDPREPTVTPPTEVPPATNTKVAIASVQLLQDCPDPVPAAAAPSTPTPGVSAPIVRQMGDQAPSRSMQKPMAGDTADGSSFRRMCSQSTVQLSVQADGVQPFKIVAVRVLAANGKKVVGSTKLRAPTTWDDATGTYGEWQEYTAAGKDLKVSYKMGDLEFTSAAERLSGDKFNTYTGPFLLEITVSAGGKRKTVRSPEFMREPPHVMVT